MDELLEFEKCNTAKQQKFLPLLKQLGSYTTHLDMEGHGSNVAFLDVFETCPRLTHFTFTNPSVHAYTLYGLYDKEPTTATTLQKKSKTSTSSLPSSSHNGKQLQQIQEKWKDRSINGNIISLVFDAVLEKHKRLEPILRKCPNLRHLTCSNGVVRKGREEKGEEEEEEEEEIYPSYDTTIPDLDDLFSWCPKLYYLEINTDQGYQSNRFCSILQGFNYSEGKQRYQQHELHGLQYFMTYEGDDYGAERIGPLLIRYASTLKCIILARAIATITPDEDWSFMFESIPSCPYLDTLVLINLTYQGSALTTMLQHCPHVQTVIIRNNLLMPLKLTSILKSLRRLKHLELDTVSLQMDDDGYSGETLIHLLQQLSNDEEPQHYSLAEIWFTNVPEVTHELLIAATYIPSIKSIRMMLDSRLYSDEGLVLFSQRLHLTSIESLELSRIRSLSYDFLCALGELTSLKRLSIQAAYDVSGRSQHVLVDGPGFADMLCKSTSLQYIFVEEAHVEKSTDISQGQVDIIHKTYDITPYGRKTPSRLICQRCI